MINLSGFFPTPKLRIFVQIDHYQNQIVVDLALIVAAIIGSRTKCNFDWHLEKHGPIDLEHVHLFLVRSHSRKCTRNDPKKSLFCFKTCNQILITIYTRNVLITILVKRVDTDNLSSLSCAFLKLLRGSVFNAQRSRINN